MFFLFLGTKLTESYVNLVYQLHNIKMSLEIVPKHFDVFVKLKQIFTAYEYTFLPLMFLFSCIQMQWFNLIFDLWRTQDLNS